MNDTIEKLMAAKAALEAAQKACETAGLTITCGTLSRNRGTDDALASCVVIATDRIASAERQSLSIAIGDEVLVHDVNGHRRPQERHHLAGVGRSLVTLTPEHGRSAQFRLVDGRENDRFEHRWIDADDLARIKRDLVKPAKGGKR